MVTIEIQNENWPRVPTDFMPTGRAARRRRARCLASVWTPNSLLLTSLYNAISAQHSVCNIDQSGRALWTWLGAPYHSGSSKAPQRGHIRAWRPEHPVVRGGRRSASDAQRNRLAARSRGTAAHVAQLLAERVGTPTNHSSSWQILDSISIGPRPLPPNLFPINYSRILIWHPTLYSTLYPAPTSPQILVLVVYITMIRQQ